jgi:hypothetical protein
MSEGMSHKHEFIFEDKSELYPLIAILKSITELNARASNQLPHPIVCTDEHNDHSVQVPEHNRSQQQT